MMSVAAFGGINALSGGRESGSLLKMPQYLWDCIVIYTILCGFSEKVKEKLSQRGIFS